MSIAAKRKLHRDTRRRRRRRRVPPIRGVRRIRRRRRRRRLRRRVFAHPPALVRPRAHRQLGLVPSAPTTPASTAVRPPILRRLGRSKRERVRTLGDGVQVRQIVGVVRPREVVGVVQVEIQSRVGLREVPQRAEEFRLGSAVVEVFTVVGKGHLCGRIWRERWRGLFTRRRGRAPGDVRARRRCLGCSTAASIVPRTFADNIGFHRNGTSGAVQLVVETTSVMCALVRLELQGREVREGPRMEKKISYALQTVFPSSSFLQSGVAVVWQL